MFWQVAACFAGGLGLFLFGMQMMSSGMQKAAGDRLRKALEVLTSKPVIGILTGLAVTFIIQSSSSTTVMTVGFVNAGLLTLEQAVGIIFGANIGTTVTAQAVSFKLEVLALPAIGIGGFLNFFGRRRMHRYVGQAILGFGLLFLGITTMSAGLEPLKEVDRFLNALVYMAKNPLLGVLTGLILTAVIQSSSAVTATIISMAAVDVISLEAALPIVLGSNIGTTVTALIASIGTNLSARRVAVAHTLFNVVGVIIAIIFLKPFTKLVLITASAVPRQIANAHTLFNVANTLLMLPFFKRFVYLVKVLVPGQEISFGAENRYLDERVLKSPAIAIGAVRQEVLRMAAIAWDMVDKGIYSYIHDDGKELPQIQQMEDLVDSLEKDITTFLSNISQHSLTMQQSQAVTGMMHAVNDIERIGDHAQTIVRLTEIKIEDRLVLSDAAIKELEEIYSKVKAMLDKALLAFKEEELKAAREVVKDDDMVDHMERILRKHHIERINNRACIPKSGVIYLDLLSNLERIADHATNLAQVVLGEF